MLVRPSGIDPSQTRIIDCDDAAGGDTLKADEFRLSGTVRNLRDGRVEIICEGAEEDIKKLIEWCKHGPEGAVVERVDVTWQDYTGEFKWFRVVY